MKEDTKSLSQLKIALILISIMLFNSTYAQQEFKFKYILKKDLLDRGVLREKVVVSGFKSKTFDSWYINGKDTVKIYSFSDSIRWDKRKLLDGRQLLATIEGGSDTFKIKPWYAPPQYKYLQDAAGNELPLNNDAEYMFVLSSDEYDLTWKGYPYISIPYQFRQLTATNIPFIYNLTTEKFTANLLNANLTYLWLLGHTRYYKSKFVTAKNWYYGAGPFAGFNIYEVSDSDEKKVGLNAGINGTISFYNFNFLLAAGAQKKFDTAEDKVELYIGFGIGFKLIDVFTPNGKD